jgi:NAD(P)-dependent dehydrogenase (short-subunit alcohol dehydrogenase family)
MPGTEMPAHPVAMVTGGNRGIGYAVCRQLAVLGYQVILAARDLERGREAAAALAEAGLVTPAQLDVTDEESLRTFADWLETRFGHVHVLVNNAGVHPDPGGYNGERRGASVFKVDLPVIRTAMATHLEGPFRLIQLLVPMMRAQGYGRIVNVASTLGQFDSIAGGWPGYRISKIALNGLTALVAEELADEGMTDIHINSVCPGWARTALGGELAPQSPDEAADTITWLATQPADGPKGGFFQNRSRIPW